MTKDFKQTIGETTEKVETKAKEYWDKLTPNYSNLEPWQRGLILLGLLGLTTLTIYWLIKNKDDKGKLTKGKDQLEAQAEERLLRRMEFFKKLQK